MPRPRTPRRPARRAALALVGALAVTPLIPVSASADAPAAIPGWTRGGQDGVLAFSTTGATGTIWADGTHKAPVRIGATDATGKVTAWSADGTRVLLTAADGKSVADVNPWTAKLVETMADPAGKPMLGTSLSPDGRTYAWGTSDDGSRTGNPYDGATSHWTHGSIGTAWSGSDRLAWINDARDPDEVNDDPGIFVASQASDGSFSTIHAAVLTDELDGEPPLQVSLSADGTKLAYSALDTSKARRGIVVSSAENSSTPRRLETDGAPSSDERFAIVSPDGTKVAFASDRSGAWALYTANWDGSGIAAVPNTTLPAGQSYTGLAWQPSQQPDLAYDQISAATEVGSSIFVDVLEGQEQGTVPLTTTYKWQRCDDGTVFSCVDIGVSTEKLALTEAHLGHRYRVLRTVSNPAGADTLPSEITEPIAPAPVVDTDPPASPTFGTAPGTRSSSRNPTFAWTAAESGGTFECSLDGAAFETCTTPLQVPISADGPHGFRVRQVDAAGNKGAIAEHAWTVDTVPPSKPVIDAKPAAVTKTTSTRFTFTGDEAGGSFECRIGSDGASWTPCTSPVDITGMGDGDKRFSIRQLDAAGNVSDPAIVTWRVDTTTPAQPVVTTDLSGTVATTTKTVAFVGEADATFACSVDGSAFAACTSPFELTGLTTGPHLFAVKQTDLAGNVGAAREVPFDVDVTGPAKPTITGKPDPVVATPKVAFAFVGAEADGAGFECAVDDVASWKPCVSGVEIDGLPEGKHTFRVRQLDAHGTPGDEATHAWTYDATPPAKPALAGDLGTVRTKQVEVAFSGEQPGGQGTFECRFDGGAWKPCASPTTVTDYGPGPHTTEVREIDAAGNIGAVAADSWVADFSGPAAPKVVASPDPRTEATNARIELHLADPHAVVEYALDGGAWTPTALPLVLTGLAVGDHVVLVRQTDDGGNHGKAIRIAWTVVAPAPAPTPEAPAPAPSPDGGKTPATVPAPAAPAAPAKAPSAPAAKAELTARIGDAPAGGSGSSGTATGATITVRKDAVGVGCSITGTVLTSCRVDLYAPAARSGVATGRAARTPAGRVLVGTGTYRAQAGRKTMDVAVKLNARGRALLRRSPQGLEVAVAITGRPMKGAALKARGTATLVAPRTSATVGGFAVDSATLPRAAQRQLATLARQLRGAAVTIRIVGHTDGAPNDARYLRDLGLRRARVVAAFLRARGVTAKASVSSRGDEQPRATNRTEAGRAQNRRVELRIDR